MNDLGRLKDAEPPRLAVFMALAVCMVCAPVAVGAALLYVLVGG